MLNGMNQGGVNMGVPGMGNIPIPDFEDVKGWLNDAADYVDEARGFIEGFFGGGSDSAGGSNSGGSGSDSGGSASSPYGLPFGLTPFQAAMIALGVYGLIK